LSLKKVLAIVMLSMMLFSLSCGKKGPPRLPEEKPAPQKELINDK
jgi:predicted small lipoprotein YifL